jgi:hypothetical protein
MTRSPDRLRPSRRSTSARRSIRTALAGLAVGATIVGPAHAQVQQGTGITRLISLSSAGFQGDWHSGINDTFPTASDVAPSITPDGRFVAFSSRATNLAGPGPRGREQEVYVRDRDPDRDGILDNVSTTSLASVTDAGTLANAGSMWPAITPNGRFVVFTSIASDLVPNDTNGMADVFVHDRDADGNGAFDESGPGRTATVRVSVPDPSSGATQALFPGQTFWKGFNQQNGQPLPGHCLNNGVPVSPCESPLAGVAANSAASISADGRFVAFYSYVPNLLGTDANGSNLDNNRCGPADHPDACGDVFVHDRDADGDGSFYEAGNLTKTELVSVGIFGGSGSDHSGDDPSGSEWLSRPPAISADGRSVAFQSWAEDLVPGDTNTFLDVFVRDRLAGTTKRLSVTNAGSQVFGRSFNPATSANGRYVIFESKASTLIPGDTDDGVDIVYRDRDPDGNGVPDEPGSVTTVKANLSSAGGLIVPPGATFQPSISASGRFVGLQSTHSGVQAGLFLGGRQVFVKDLQTGMLRLASVGRDGLAGLAVTLLTDGNSFGIAVSDSGWSAFMSRAMNLTSDDTNLCPAAILIAGVTIPNPLNSACTDVFVHLPGTGLCVEAFQFCPFSDQV